MSASTAYFTTSSAREVIRHLIRIGLSWTKSGVPVGNRAIHDNYLFVVSCKAKTLAGYPGTELSPGSEVTEKPFDLGTLARWVQAALAGN